MLTTFPKGPESKKLKLTREEMAAALTKKEAASALGRSTRKIERLIEEGKLRKGMRPIPGRKAMPVICRADVEKLLAENAASEELKERDGSAIVPRRADVMQLATTQPVSDAALGIAASFEMFTDRFAQLVEHMTTRKNGHTVTPVSLKEKLLLTVDDAAALGVPQRLLRQWIKAAEVRNIGSHRKPLVPREELERRIRGGEKP